MSSNFNIIGVNGATEFRTLDAAKKAANKNEGSEAIVKVDNHYELRKINDENNSTAHATKNFSREVKFTAPLSPKEEFVCFSLAESDTSVGTDKIAGSSDEAQIYNTVSELSKADKNQKIEAALNKITSGKFDSLPNDVKEELKNFLDKFDIDELMKMEVQGNDGLDKAEGGVKGAGKGGHYVNSIMSSIGHLISDNRLTAGFLKEINTLSNTRLASDLNSHENKTALIRSCMQDIAYPETIAQHSRGTCVATTVQALLAMKDPSRYVQILTSLASPKGELPESLVPKNPTGDSMKRVNGTLTSDQSGRSSVGMLMQAAFMEYGNNAKVYDNSKDTNYDKAKGEAYNAFLLPDELGILEKGVMGGEYKTKTGIVGSTGIDRKNKINNFYDNLKNGPVSVSLKWENGGGHEILAIRADAKNVYFMNPAGKLESLSRKEFDRNMMFFAYPEKSEHIKDLPSSVNDTKNYTNIDKDWASAIKRKEDAAIDKSQSTARLSVLKDKGVVNSQYEISVVNDPQSFEDQVKIRKLLDEVDVMIKSKDKIDDGLKKEIRTKLGLE